ncbi:hypothetical protein R3W88_031657 [Solanum pinnatisectum]|uniref:Ubiquitin-like protease family profile domain-containing protein n=1 Tax=Solanum pinnatisectum TaxID=50273 RepID=A0AAV9LQP1_9SOLN|nr:hypothetical protein R3W88_031657 [Solanum pinnatisectum]
MEYVVAFSIDKNWSYAMSQPKKIMNQYIYTTVNCLFSSHNNNTHERYYNNEADDNFSTQEHIDRASAVSHLVDNVYISVNCDGKFHWVLAVVELNQRLIRVYDSSIGTRTKVYSEEIKKLSRDKQTGTLLESHHPFNVEYAQGIMQQECDSLDYGLYVATFAEFLSDQLVIPSDTDALLWRYDSDKVKGGYISENDDPPKPKGQFTTPTEEDFVNID